MAINALHFYFYAIHINAVTLAHFNRAKSNALTMLVNDLFVFIQQIKDRLVKVRKFWRPGFRIVKRSWNPGHGAIGIGCKWSLGFPCECLNVDPDLWRVFRICQVNIRFELAIGPRIDGYALDICSGFGFEKNGAKNTAKNPEVSLAFGQANGFVVGMFFDKHFELVFLSNV